MSTRTWFIVGVATAVILGGGVSVLRRRRAASRVRIEPGESVPASPIADARAATAPTPDVRQPREETSETPTVEYEATSDPRNLQHDVVAPAVSFEQQPPGPHYSALERDQRSAEPPNEPASTFYPETTVRPSPPLSPDLMTPATLVVEAESLDAGGGGGILVLDDAEKIPVADLEALSIVPDRYDGEEASPDVDANVDEPDALLQVTSEDGVLDQVQPVANVAEVVSASRAVPVETIDASQLAQHTNNEHAATAVQDGEADVAAAVTSKEVVERPKQRTIYRNRRGTPRAKTSPVRTRNNGRQSNILPADVSLRLSLHPIQRDVRLSAVLGRPEGFPDCVTLTLYGQRVQAYDDRRYDDIDVPAGMNLLGDELRFDTVERLQFLRSARRIQLFSTTPIDPDQVSVSAARAGTEHAILCHATDVGEVRRIAQLAGSPPLVSHDGWPGVPPGCAVLSAYIPERAITEAIEPSLRTLDPGVSISINLSGGLAIRPKVFAQGHPPHISIDDLPKGTAVTIGGETAQQAEGGDWIAAGWDVPGRHIIDIVPGPSLTYEIAPDPMSTDGWPWWNAYGDLFEPSAAAWTRAEICGAYVAGPAGNIIITSDTQSTVVALGTHSTAVALRNRPDMPVSVGAVPPGAAFLLSAAGPRRHQGRIIWIGDGAPIPHPTSAHTDLHWANLVRSAASRRLPLLGADEAGERAWRAAVARARRLTRGEGR